MSWIGAERSDTLWKILCEKGFLKAPSTGEE